ncbi:tail fiber domain-containing protein [Halalkalibacter lacteus]|uniref:tail fiber domain-containing protein n=1 Tax=Halalkalibacter lacteus TaxID=3090663 RepID=UPI002FCA8277
MNRRNFLANFLLWFLAVFFGYKAGSMQMNTTDPSEIIDTDGVSVSDNLKHLNEKVTETRHIIGDRGINIKYPPAPLVGAKVDGVTDDTEAIRAAFALAEKHQTKIIIPGVSVITGEIEVKSPVVIEGVGSGAGYGKDSLLDYRQISGFLVQGSGKKRVRTRRKHRANVSDPQDDPLSVALNIQADNVVLKDFTVFLDFDKKNNSPTHYGANWDVGIFVGTRTNFITDNVHVLGYFREASVYYDVTHATNLPRFNDLNGNPYDNTNNTSGGDGCTMYKPFIKGGKWGIFVAGAIRSGSNSNYSDGMLGKTVPDWRGSFGFSDFTIFGGQVYGTDHHSDYRRNGASGNYITDSAGGCLFIDGFANNSNQTVQGMRFFGTRFSSFEPYRVRLDRANRVMFYGCHIEIRQSDHRKNPNGSTITFDNTDLYGPISCTERTDNLFTEGLPMQLNLQFIPSSVAFDNYAPLGDSEGARTTRRMNANGFGATSGTLDLRSGDPSSAVRFRHGNNAAALLDSTGFKFLSTISNPSIVSTAGELDLRSAPDSLIRFRIGANSLAFFDNTSFRPSIDNNTSIGSSSLRFKQVYAGTGTINTSDKNAKKDMKPINDKVLDAWSDVAYSQFRFKDAVKEKGKAARTHFGIIAQEIEIAFKRHGLNAFDYGILCYDEWDDMYEEMEEEKTVVDEETGEETIMSVKTGKMKKVKSAGRLYSIRPDECLMLESALMRRTNKRLEERLSALEKA